MAAKKAQLGMNSKLNSSPDEADFCKPTRTVLGQAISIALIAGIASSPVVAQESALEEIIVTATKRAESVMDVPLAITAMSGQFIMDANLNDVKDLIAFTPGITGNSKDSFLDFISVRGIRTIDFGNGGDPSVSFYKNGLYQGRTGSAVSSLYDIERAEILRGPQGFLFGRNSISGAMNIITAKPNMKETEGYAEFDIGERGVLVFEGAISIPTSENFAFRIAGYHSEEDGFVKNLAGGPDLISHDKDALRISGRYQTDKLTADIFFEYEDRDQTGTVYRATGEGNAFLNHQTRINGGVPIAVAASGRDVNNDNSLDSIDQTEIFAIGLQFDYDMGWGTFTSVTGFKDHEYDYVEDFDGSPLVLFNYGQDQEGDYFEQEFRVTSSTEGPLSWYAGASYYKEDIDTIFLGQQEEDVYCLGYWYNTCQDMFDYYNYLDTYYGNTYYADNLLSYYFGSATWTPSPDGLINDRNHIVGKYSGYSTYIDISYEFTDSFDMSFGLRYSYDKKEFSQEVLADPGNSQLAFKVQTGFQTPNGPLSDTQNWDKVTWRVIANWHPTDNSLLFGSVTTGYKPGGFGSFNIEPGCADVPFGLCIADNAVDKPGDFGPETVISYEVGYKGTINDGRTQFAATAFFYDYEDLQAIFGEGPRTIVDNVGQIDGRGFELEVNTALSDNASLKLGMSWFDSEAHNVQAFCGAGEILTGSADACEGNSIPWAPEWTAFAVLNASFEAGSGEVYGNVAWTWEDDYRGDWPDPSVIFQKIDALDQTDISIGYRQDSWRVNAYVENVFNNVWYDGNYSDDVDPVVIFSQHVFGPSRPRTAGVRFSYRY